MDRERDCAEDDRPGTEPKPVHFSDLGIQSCEKGILDSPLNTRLSQSSLKDFATCHSLEIINKYHALIVMPLENAGMPQYMAYFEDVVIFHYCQSRRSSLIQLSVGLSLLGLSVTPVLPCLTADGRGESEVVAFAPLMRAFLTALVIIQHCFGFCPMLHFQHTDYFFTKFLQKLRENTTFTFLYLNPNMQHYLQTRSVTKHCIKS